MRRLTRGARNVRLRLCDQGWRELRAMSAVLCPRLAQDVNLASIGIAAGAKAVFINFGRTAIAAALKVAARRGPSVIIPAFLCNAVTDAIQMAGKRPQFADIGDDLNLDVDRFREGLNSNTGAVVVPHMFGKPAQIQVVERACAPMDVLVVDDAAAAMGIKHNGRYLGTFGDAGVFSFAQQKSLVAGQGGVLLANSTRMRNALRRIELDSPRELWAAVEILWWFWEYRYCHVLSDLRYYCVRLKRFVFRGPKRKGVRLERMSRVCLAMAKVQINRMGEILATRRRNCRELHDRIIAIPGVSVPQYYRNCALTKFFVRTPGIGRGRTDEGFRREHPLAEHLARLGIETSKPYVPLHWQADLSRYVTRPLPRTDEIVPELVALPVQGKMTEWQYDAIASGIRSFLGK